MTACSASIEWLCEHAGVLRVHPMPGGRWQDNDPYVWSCTVDRHGDTATLKGVCKPLGTTDRIRAVFDALRAAGIVRRRYERHHGRIVAKEM